MDTTAQIWILTAQSTNLELNNCFLGWNECEILTHSQQLPQVPNTHKKKPTIRLTTRVTMLWGPPKGHFFTGSCSQLRYSTRHITENAPRHFQRLLAWLL